MHRPILKSVILSCANAIFAMSAMAQSPAVHKPADTKRPVITAIAIAPGGRVVATAGDDHLVRLWSTETGRMLHRLEGHSDWVRSLAFSPDGNSLASGGDDGQIILWQTDRGTMGLRTTPSSQAVYALHFSPDGKLLAAAGFSQDVMLYDPQTGQVTRRLQGPAADLRAIAFSPDGSRLAVGGRGGRIRVWEMPRAVPRDFAGDSARIRALAWLPDGTRLAVAGHGRTVTIWDAAAGKEFYRFPCPAGAVMALAVCGESWIATGGSDNVVRVWNWKTQSEVDRLVGHTGSVAAMAFDVASETIVSGGFDTTVRFWKLSLDSTTQNTQGAARPADSRR